METTVQRTIKTNIEPGIHQVEITKVAYHENADELLIENSSGDLGIEIDFTSNDGEDHTEVFWWGEKTIWRWRNLLAAIGVKGNDKKSLEEDDLVGKKLWIKIGLDEVVDSNGEVQQRYFIFEFLPFKAKGAKPAEKGDPARSKTHKPSGRFYKQTVIENELEAAPEPEAVDNFEEEEEGF